MKSFFKIAKREGGLFPPRIFSVLLLLVLPTQTVGKHETFLFLLFILEKPQGLICQMGRDPVLPPEWPYILFFTTPTQEEEVGLLLAVTGRPAFPSPSEPPGGAH